MLAAIWREPRLLVWAVCAALLFGLALPLSAPATKKVQQKVVIAGAGSSVGYLTFKKLMKKKNFHPVGLVRDRKGFDALRKLGADPTEQIKICDITVKESLDGIFEDADKVVICTSASPRKKFISKLKGLLGRLILRPRAPKTKDFYYRNGQRPYEVDYLGQKNIIDQCMKAQISQVVLLGSMGGYRGSKQNDIGRKADDSDIRNGNILKWKRAAERYLMKRCYFTILHAGQLTNEKGGKREIVWDTDDALLRTNFRKIPMEDVAEVIAQSLVWKEAIGRSIDIASLPEGDGLGPTKDWLRFWARPGNCVYPNDFDDNKFK